MFIERFTLVLLIPPILIIELPEEKGYTRSASLSYFVHLHIYFSIFFHLWRSWLRSAITRAPSRADVPCVWL